MWSALLVEVFRSAETFLSDAGSENHHQENRISKLTSAVLAIKNLRRVELTWVEIVRRPVEKGELGQTESVQLTDKAFV